MVGRGHGWPVATTWALTEDWPQQAWRPLDEWWMNERRPPKAPSSEGRDLRHHLMGWDSAEKWAENEEPQGSRSKPWFCLVPSGRLYHAESLFPYLPKEANSYCLSRRPTPKPGPPQSWRQRGCGTEGSVLSEFPCAPLPVTGSPQPTLPHGLGFLPSG